MRLGTYSTIDCPTKKEGEALAYLQAEFDKIDGNVKRVLNPHDFGMYPSFEIDYPDELNDIVECEEYGNDCECEDCKLTEKLDTWHDKANAIEASYSKKFSNYL